MLVNHFAQASTFFTSLCDLFVNGELYNRKLRMMENWSNLRCLTCKIVSNYLRPHKTHAQLLTGYSYLLATKVNRLVTC